MTQTDKTAVARATATVKAPGEGGAVLLAIGGLAAAFGAASCCALPVLLASLGLGSAGSAAWRCLPGPIGWACLQPPSSALRQGFWCWSGVAGRPRSAHPACHAAGRRLRP
jgi:hypothetical protein